MTSFGASPLPGAKAALRPYRGMGIRCFVATNQAGPVFRAVTGSSRYPTAEQVILNIGAGLRDLSFCPDLFVLCCHSGKDGDEWLRAAREVGEQFHRRLVSALKAIDYAVFFALPFRKPQPGMLAYAASYFKARTADIVYVGDMESDEIAARQCGARFVDAAEWREGAALG